MKNKNFQKRSPLLGAQKIHLNVKIKKLANKFILFSIVFCSVYFVLCVNDIAIKGFVIKDLRYEVAEITEKNKEIELKISDLQSLENISNRIDMIKMVKVDKIDYITVVNGSVALRE